MTAIGFGCAYSTVRPVEYANAKQRGYRFYDPLPLLVEGCGATQIVYVPDFSRGYSVQPRTWLSEQNFEIQLADGRLSQAKSDVDTSALLTLIQTVGSEAIKNAAALSALSDTVTEMSRPKATVRALRYDGTGKFIGFGPAYEMGPCPEKKDPPKDKSGGDGGKGQPAGGQGAQRPKS